MEADAKRAIWVTVVAALVFTAGVQVALVAGVPASTAVFRFSAAGDFGSWSGFSDSLRQLSGTASDFAIALGDLSYGGESESDWCREFKRYFDSVVLIAGNHDTGQPPAGEGDINAFAQHCPFPLPEPIVGEYAKQFYFDYPAGSPLSRFILISPDILFQVDGGQRYRYDLGTPRYNWTAAAIDGARASGIPWVIVGMHKNCVAAGDHPCEIGTDIFNLLLDRRVDLILQGHTHHYARSHQLALSPGECTGIVLQTFQAGCISHRGDDRRYVQGSGSVLVIAGIGGRDIDPFNPSDPYAGYFAASQGAFVPPGPGKGVVSFDVGIDHISMQTHVTGDYSDAFTIVSSSRHGSPIPGFLGILGLAGSVAAGTGLAFARWVARRARRPSPEGEPPGQNPGC